MTHNYKDLTKDLNAKLAEMRKEKPDSGVAMRCQGCLGFHAKALVKLGCTRAEFMEMLQVAMYMGGGPSVMTAAEALMAFEEFGGETA